MSEPRPAPRWGWWCAAYALGALVAAGAGPAAARLDLPFARSLGGAPALTLEVFALAATLLIALTVWLLHRRGALEPEPARWGAVLWVLVSCYLLHLTVAYSRRAGDFSAYTAAAEALLAGENPYRVDEVYLYPPPTVQVTAAVFSLVNRALPDRETAWDAVFYLFVAGRYFALQAIVLLLYLLALRCGIGPRDGALLVGALMVIDYPLINGLRFNQVSPLMLLPLVAAMLLAERRPFAAGAVTAAGVMMKIYPAALLLPWLLRRDQRALGGFAAGCLLLCAVSSRGFTELALWSQWAAMTAGFPPSVALNDSSLYSLVCNGFRLVGLSPWGNPPQISLAMKLLVNLATLAAIGWVVWRMIGRARLEHGEARWLADACDAVALALLVSPNVWPHHWILAVPLLIVATARQGRTRPWLVFAAGLLVLAVPEVSIYLLGHRALLGLALLFWLLAQPADESSLASSSRAAA